MDQSDLKTNNSPVNKEVAKDLPSKASVKKRTKMVVPPKERPKRNRRSPMKTVFSDRLCFVPKTALEKLIFGTNKERSKRERRSPMKTTFSDKLCFVPKTPLEKQIFGTSSRSVGRPPKERSANNQKGSGRSKRNIELVQAGSSKQETTNGNWRPPAKRTNCNLKPPTKRTKGHKAYQPSLKGGIVIRSR